MPINQINADLLQSKIWFRSGVQISITAWKKAGMQIRKRQPSAHPQYKLIPFSKNVQNVCFILPEVSSCLALNHCWSRSAKQPAFAKSVMHSYRMEKVYHRLSLLLLLQIHHLLAGCCGPMYAFPDLPLPGSHIDLNQ